MKPTQNTKTHQLPVAKLYRRLVLFLLLLVIVLAITAGYYYQLHWLELKRYKRIEDQFVRLRSQLGTAKTNQLIEDSYTQTEK